MDMIFVVRQLLQKCIEQNMPLFSVVIDLTKAFNRVNRKALWTVLEHIGRPQKFVRMIQLFHDGMTGQVLSSGDEGVTETFEISDGVKQDCVLAPVLFNVFFSACCATQSEILRRVCTSGTTLTALCLTFVVSLPKQSALETSYRKPCLPMTVLLWPTTILTCR